MPFELMPIGAGFETNQTRPDLTDAQEVAVIKEFEQKMTELQRAFRYKNARGSELEESFIIKPLFILNRGLPSQPQHQQVRAALMLLVADQDVLFKDADDKYFSLKSSADFYANLKAEYRELKGFKIEENSVLSQLICFSLMAGFRFQGGDFQAFKHRADVELAAKILRDVILKAKSSRSGVFGWLYLSKHITPSQYNRDSYQDAYQIGEDGYLDQSRRLPENNSEQLEFAKKLKTEKHLGFGMIDVEACARDFESLVSECKGNPICSMSFYEKVVYSLHQFAVQERKIKERAPERDYDEERIIQNFAGFQERYQRICALEDGFRNLIIPVQTTKGLGLSWGTSSNQSKRTKAILDAIKNYRRTMNMAVIQDDDKDYLAYRIDWLFDTSKNRKLPQDDFLKPIFILAFVLSYKKKEVKSLGNIKIELGEIFPNYSNQTSVAKQRFAQIKLLDEVHAALELSDDSCAKSWNTYFSLQRKELQGKKLQGREILSEDELLFWRDKLQGRYELLPIIGFQLCFLDFCSDCMSPHPERLAYSSFRVVYDNPFHDFYVQNSSAIRKLSVSILEHSDSHVGEIVRQYRKLWKEPKTRSEEIRRTIRPLRELLQKDTDLFERAPSEDIIELTIEVAIRLSFIMKAQDKLTEWFDKIYECSLKKLNNPAFLSNNDDEDRKS